MISYKFETDKFGLSETGIHLLRSRYNYETIEFSSIDQIRFEKGKQIKNWLFTLLFGVALIAVGLYVLYHVLYEYFIGNRVHVFYIEQFAFPVLPLLVGTYCIYISLKTGFILRIITKNKNKTFPLGRLNKKSQKDDLVTFFNINNLTKTKFKSGE